MSNEIFTKIMTILFGNNILKPIQVSSTYNYDPRTKQTLYHYNTIYYSFLSHKYEIGHAVEPRLQRMSSGSCPMYYAIINGGIKNKKAHVKRLGKHYIRYESCSFKDEPDIESIYYFLSFFTLKNENIIPIFKIDNTEIDIFLKLLFENLNEKFKITLFAVKDLIYETFDLLECNCTICVGQGEDALYREEEYSFSKMPIEICGQTDWFNLDLNKAYNKPPEYEGFVGDEKEKTKRTVIIRKEILLKTMYINLFRWFFIKELIDNKNEEFEDFVSMRGQNRMGDVPEIRLWGDRGNGWDNGFFIMKDGIYTCKNKCLQKKINNYIS